MYFHPNRNKKCDKSSDKANIESEDNCEKKFYDS